jgi:hypothetical protein
MFPNPLFVLSLTKLLMKQSPDIFYDIRGTLPNAISALMGISLAQTIRDPSNPVGPTRYLTTIVKLINMVKEDPTRYRFVDDLTNH